MVNLPAGSVRPEDVGSAVRFVIAWAVGAAGIKLTDGELNDFTMIAATVVAFALTWLWSRAKNRRLLEAVPPAVKKANEEAEARIEAAAKAMLDKFTPRPDESRAEFDARVGNPSPGSSSSRIGPVVVLALTAGVMAAGMVGCQNVGPRADFSREGAAIATPSPVTLDIQDNDKRGTASGVGPARFTSITETEVQTMQTGSTPRDLFLIKLPDGTVRFNLSSGTDIQAEGLDFDAASGSFRVDRFGTSTSEPIRAGNEAYDRLVAYWTGLSEAQKEARLAEIDALKVTAPELADLILGIVTGL